MLRIFFWILIIANGALFAFHQDYFNSSQEKREPQRLLDQFNGDKLKLLLTSADRALPVATASLTAIVTQPDSAPGTDVYPTQAVAPTPAIEAPPNAESSKVEAPPPVAAPLLVDAPPPVAAPLVAAPLVIAPPVIAPQAASASLAMPKEVQNVVACVEIGNFSGRDAKRIEKRLSPLALGQNQSRIPVEKIVNHMVYIPALGSKEVADRTAVELQRMGVTNFFIMPDTLPNRRSISLGIFKTEQAAKNHLAVLSKQGVRGARVGPRTVMTDKVLFRLRNLEPAFVRAVDKIMLDFPVQKQRECNTGFMHGQE